jgi:hypothetical protein
MLWTELRKVVTRDGQTLVGEQVRDWLEAREVIANGGDDLVKVETNADPRIVLRTRDELAAWLREVQLCKLVELGDPPPVNPLRVAARGVGVQNQNHTPLRVEFFAVNDDQVITRLELEQGKCKRVAVRVTPAPKRARVTLELAFIGAKLRSRAAVRSVRDSDTGYRYLSRVRVADGRDGLAKPLRELGEAVVTGDYRNRKKRAEHYRIREFTLMGLEAGTELMQACLLDGSNVHASAVLEISVTRPASNVGALRVVHHDTVDAYMSADPEFDVIYRASSQRGGAGEIRVGICDSGVYDDTNTAGAEAYLADRWVAGKYFDAVVGEANDRDTKPGGNHANHVLDESPSMHGTNVAGQAMWGTPNIKLVDVMVQRGQETGMMTDATAARAFRWAAEQGVRVVNCSKVMPFRGHDTHAVVSGDPVVQDILFLATGGNTRVSFPLNTSSDTLQLRGEVDLGSLPTSMANTLWVGGCKTDRTPHEARGFGPAIEVMVPSDRQSLFSPGPLRAAFRAQKIAKFRTDILAELERRDLAIVNPPPRIAGSLSVVKRMQLQNLEQQAWDSLSPSDQNKLLQLRAERDDAPNPAYHEKQAYAALVIEIRGWPADDLAAWADRVVTLRDDLVSDEAARSSATGCVRTIQGQARTALRELLNDQINIRGIVSHRDELRAVTLDGGHIGSDEGVSFGLPIVANLAAKLALINNNLTANQLKRIIIDTADIDPGFETQCIARGIINPLRAYLAAYDNEVSVGGHLHHDYRPTVAAIDEARRVYYTFFYMDAEGLALYRAIRQRLVDSYAAMNIDLVEAEPPVAIPSEPLTYVEGPAILRHNWTKVVPVEIHPLVYPGRQLRLVLVNETALVIGNAFEATLEEHAISKVAPDDWTPTVELSHKVTATPQVIRTPQGDVWACRLTIADDPALARYTFVDVVEHLVTNFQVMSGIAPIAMAPSIQVNRANDRYAWIRTLDPGFNQTLLGADRVSFSVGVVQRLGGARKGRNIFVNNKYHAGPTGTPEARNSALVLFQHEIGHALGMVNPNGHAHYYNNQHGGEGDHCAFNAVDKTNDEAPNYGVIGDGQLGSVKVPVTLVDPQGHPDAAPCVMYHTRSRAHSRSTFCQECVRHLSSEINPDTWRWNSDR